MSSGLDLSALETAANEILFTKYAFIGLYAVLLYDMCLTLPLEIEYIWKRKFSFVTVLYILNRYYALCVFTVTLAALFSPLFTPEVCARFSKFNPFAIGIPMIMFPEMVMALRVSALYQRNKIIDGALVVYLIAEFVTIMYIYTLPGHHPLPLPPGVHAEPLHICIDETADSLGNIKPAIFQFMACCFDTIVFFAVLHKTIAGIRRYTKRGGQTMMGLIGAHSLVYFGVIVTSNLLWAMLILFAPVGLKYSTVLATFMLTCTIINRMTLDLRAFSTTGGWFSATRVGSEGSMGSSMPMLKARTGAGTGISASNSLAELTLNRQTHTQFTDTDTKWSGTTDYDYPGPNDSRFSTYEGHPPTFETIEMGNVQVSIGHAR